jgi:ribonuclease R
MMNERDEPGRRRRLIVEVSEHEGAPAGRELLTGHMIVPFEVDPEAVPDTGDLVLAEQYRQPSRGRQCGPPLARAGSIRAGLYRIVARFGLDPLYPDEVHREAQRCLHASGIDDPDLEDLTGLGFITIDNPDSRDLDQALYIERTSSGQGYLVYYALADASYYVRPGSALFREALSRGASFYLPGLTLPMLPRVLSEGLISLNQGQVRRSLVFRMELDKSSRCLGTELIRARICSARKLSYPRVQRYYDDPGGSGWLGEPWQETLDLLREVGKLRISEARRRNVVHYHRSELEIHLTGDHRLGFTMRTNQREDVERYNEQISLLCNVEGARLMAAVQDQAHVQAVFRVHPAPSDAALASLANLIEALVEQQQLDSEEWLWQGNGEGEPLADYLDRLPRYGRYRRISRAIERQARMLNERSTFEDEPAPHHGIGAPCYARFSSPMREIVGVFTHKEALEVLAGPAQAPPAAPDIELRQQVLEAGNRAKEIQRQLTKQAHRLLLDRLLGSELDTALPQRPRRKGTIMGVTTSRLYVQLDDPGVDIKVYVADIEAQLGEHLVLDDREIALTPDRGNHPPLRIGDPIVVYVAGFDPKRNRWRFHLDG